MRYIVDSYRVKTCLIVNLQGFFRMKAELFQVFLYCLNFQPYLTILLTRTIYWKAYLEKISFSLLKKKKWQIKTWDYRLLWYYSWLIIMILLRIYITSWGPVLEQDITMYEMSPSWSFPWSLSFSLIHSFTHSHRLLYHSRHRQVLMQGI